MLGRHNDKFLFSNSTKYMSLNYALEFLVGNRTKICIVVAPKISLLYNSRKKFDFSLAVALYRHRIVSLHIKMVHKT